MVEWILCMSQIVLFGYLMYGLFQECKEPDEEEENGNE